MNNNTKSKIVSYVDNKVIRRKDLGTLTIFLTKSDQVFGLTTHYPMNNDRDWNCGNHIHTDTLHNILRYMHFMEKTMFVVSFNMDHMVDTPSELVTLINNILSTFPKSFIFVNSIYGYAPQIFKDVTYKGKVSLTIPQNTTYGKLDNLKYFKHQAKVYGFVSTSKARHIVSGHPLVIPHPEVTYATGETRHAPHSLASQMDTNFMVCNSGSYINPDGGVSTCINDVCAMDKQYVLDNVNNQTYAPIPKVTMCRGLGCPGGISKHVRSLELYAQED